MKSFNYLPRTGFDIIVEYRLHSLSIHCNTRSSMIRILLVVFGSRDRMTYYYLLCTYYRLAVSRLELIYVQSY